MFIFRFCITYTNTSRLSEMLIFSLHSLLIEGRLVWLGRNFQIGIPIFFSSISPHPPKLNVLKVSKVRKKSLLKKSEHEQNISSAWKITYFDLEKGGIGDP